jgi:hypothetical protein
MEESGEQDTVVFAHNVTESASEGGGAQQSPTPSTPQSKELTRGLPPEIVQHFLL